MEFIDWLKEEKKLKQNSAYDVNSHLKRVKKILDIEEIDDNTLVKLNNNNMFLALNKNIRSQLRRSVNLLLEYKVSN